MADVTCRRTAGTIAFSSKREGDDVAQVYLLDIAGGGEARRVTNLSTGARGPQFPARRRRDLGAEPASTPAPSMTTRTRKIARERKEQKYKVRLYDSFPIRQWDRWLDDLQTHLELVPLDGSAAPHDIFAATKLVASAWILQPLRGRIARGGRVGLDAGRRRHRLLRH